MEEQFDDEDKKFKPIILCGDDSEQELSDDDNDDDGNNKQKESHIVLYENIQGQQTSIIPTSHLFSNVPFHGIGLY